MMKARLVLAALIGALFALTGAPAHADSTGKYYVVGTPESGPREYLFAIAVKTLGDGNRYREIADLNRGRAQPDGGTLGEDGEVKPGWILALPKDARGAGVKEGPPPRITPRPVATQPSVAPTPPPGNGHTVTILWCAGFVFVSLLVAAVLNILHSGARRASVADARPAPEPNDPPPPPGTTAETVRPEESKTEELKIDPDDVRIPQASTESPAQAPKPLSADPVVAMTAVPATAVPATAPWPTPALVGAGASVDGRGVVDVPLPDLPITAASTGAAPEPAEISARPH
jgi:hypothetical protein